MTKPISPCRLFGIVARSAPIAVVFRRGPTKWVQVILWHTDTDTFDFGQWFHGRIYERRCDLSPDGKKLIYFVSKLNKKTLEDRSYTYAWTAVSKPPYLTALALWPKGDCWHGGGTFENNRTVLLNHRPEVAKPHPNHLPRGLKVIANPTASGEDFPIYDERLVRDGWSEEQAFRVSIESLTAGYKTDQAGILKKQHPAKQMRLVMQQRLTKYTYGESFSIEDEGCGTIVQINRASWADWDFSGRLVFAAEGKLFSGRIEDGALVTEEKADLNSLRPKSMPAPRWATTW